MFAAMLFTCTRQCYAAAMLCSECTATPPNRMGTSIHMDPVHAGAAAELVQCYALRILYQIRNLKSYCRSVLVF